MQALPGTPVRIIGLKSLPDVGAHISVVQNEEAGNVILRARQRQLTSVGNRAASAEIFDQRNEQRAEAQVVFVHNDAVARKHNACRNVVKHIWHLI